MQFPDGDAVAVVAMTMNALSIQKIRRQNFQAESARRDGKEVEKMENARRDEKRSRTDNAFHHSKGIIIGTTENIYPCLDLWIQDINTFETRRHVSTEFDMRAFLTASL